MSALPFAIFCGGAKKGGARPEEKWGVPFPAPILLVQPGGGSRGPNIGRNTYVARDFVGASRSRSYRAAATSLSQIARESE
jgi:hypothetical protein